MNKQHAAAGFMPGQEAAAFAVPAVLPLERRRLQCYLALIVADLTAILSAFSLAGWLYLGPSGIAESMRIGELILPLFLTIALYNGSYSLRSLEDLRGGTLKALAALGVAAAAMVFIAFYTKSSTSFSRVLFSGGVAGSALAMIVLREQMRSFINWRCGDRVINTLVIRDGGPPLDLPGARQVDAAALGIVPSLSDPVSLHCIGLLLHGVDRVTISCPPAHRKAWATILRGANVEGEVVDDAVAQLGAHGARIAAGHGLLRVSVGPLGMRARAMKRAFDLIFAGLGLILLAPVFLLVALAIRLEDGGPVLFVQQRVGRGNRFFGMYKFRSMRTAQLDPSGSRSTQRDDQRITRVGALIRRTSIDELPQLLNVLKGEMSLVGPRPHALGSQAGSKLFWEVDEEYWTRHALKPGLTGLAQVRGLRGATDHEQDLAQRLDADLEYMSGWSIWRDLRIVAGTLRVLVHPKAY